MAREIRDESAWATALAGLASYLPERLLREVLVAAREIQWGNNRVFALVALAPRLAELGRRQEALMVVQALAGLTPYLPQPLLGKTLAAAQQFGDDAARANGVNRRWTISRARSR